MFKKPFFIVFKNPSFSFEKEGFKYYSIKQLKLPLLIFTFKIF